MSGSTIEILENAFDFVLQAIDDLENENDHPRRNGAKYAILHLWSGIELLVKYRLSLEHWSLIFEKIDQAQHDKLVSGELRTVAFADAHLRLKNIGGVQAIDRHLKYLKSLQMDRNKFEHFHNKPNPYAARANLMEAWGFIVDFVSETIDLKDSESAESLFLEIKDKMIANDDFVDTRRKSIRGILAENSAKEFPYAVLECPECLQDAVILSGEDVSCLFCKAELSAVDLMERLAPEEGTQPCPDCSNDSLVALESYGGEFNPHKCVCFACFTAWRPEEVAHCDRCGVPYVQPEDIEEQMSVCQSCFEYAVID